MYLTALAVLPFALLAICVAISPMKAKFVATSFRDKMAIEPRSGEDLNNMRTVLSLKVHRHPELKDSLLATGDERIIEDVTNRTRPGNHDFWGARLIGDKWVGWNMLGRLWMDLREALRAEESFK